MKQFKIIILFFCLPFLTGWHVSAQCEPDPNCTAVNNAGAFCPKIMPDIYLGKPYETVLTVIPPSEYQYEANLLDVVYIDIDSVVNFPPGITYKANAERFYADSAYCILISGVPEQAGAFTLKLYITPYIRLPLFGIIKGPQVVDNTSVVLTVQEATSAEYPDIKQFEVLQNMPNPFSQSTKIGFYTPVNDNITLKVYSVVGELIYEESRQANPGEHFFHFDGSELLAGTYIYLVKSGSSHQARKLIKLR